MYVSSHSLTLGGGQGRVQAPGLLARTSAWLRQLQQAGTLFALSIDLCSLVLVVNGIRLPKVYLDRNFLIFLIIKALIFTIHRTLYPQYNTFSDEFLKTL
jgi:hypothetical protein